MRIKTSSYFIMVILLLQMSACALTPPELPVLGQLPSFQLQNQQDQTVTLKEYQGKIWAANFIFTSCAGTCPLLTQRMIKVQDALQSIAKKNPQHPFRIISFSVDPERDTPQKLANYALEYNATSPYWTFLTGPLDQVTATVVNGFKISMGKVPAEKNAAQPSAAETFDVVHGEKFVLIDGQGRIRGYYESTSDGIQQLIRDMKRLEKHA